MEKAAPYQVEAQMRDGHLHVTITGKLPSGMSTALAKDVIGACRRFPCRTALVDVTGLRSRVDVFETVNLVTDFPVLTQGVAVPRTAVVYDAGDREMLTFYETVARNRGYMTEIFTDPAQAWAWLDL